MTLNQHSLLDPLTERELLILSMMSNGLSNREISDKLVISFETVRWYTKQIYSKLGVHSRSQAIIRARETIGSSVDTPPTLPTLAEKLSILPTYPIPFIGREQVFNDLCHLLTTPEARLITVVGMGGMGKTRLCVEVMRQTSDLFPHGMVIVTLGNANQPEDVYVTLLDSLGIRGQENNEETVFRYLQHKQMLILFDNFENVVQGSSILNRLLEACPSIKILVTSRVSLNSRGEWLRLLDGFPIPQDTDPDLEQQSAIQFFMACAHRVRGDFSFVNNRVAIIQICQLVQGMPLAIELATGWLRMLSCTNIVNEIHRSLDFLATRQHDVEERHRSIRAVFESTWKLLSSEERRILRRLSVFRGGFGHTAAAQVANAPLILLAELVDKSLIRQNANGLYEIHDLLRQYAEDKLTIHPVRDLSVLSNMMFAWSSLVKGDFEKVDEIAREVLNHKHAGTNLSAQALGLALHGIIAGTRGDYEQCQQLSQASISMIKRNHDEQDPMVLIFVHLATAVAYCGLEQYSLAIQHIRILLQLVANLHIPAFATLCLPVSAIVLAYIVEIEQATSILALAYNHPASTPHWMEHWDLLKELQADLRAELGDANFDECWQVGINRDLDQAVRDVLELLS